MSFKDVVKNKSWKIILAILLISGCSLFVSTEPNSSESLRNPLDKDKEISNLQNIKIIALGGQDDICILNDEGVKCCGDDTWGQSEVPLLIKTKALSHGSSHICALDEENVKCWGSNEFGQAQVPRLKNPKMVSAGWHHSCAIDDEGVKCWGSNLFGRAKSHLHKKYQFVSAGGYHTCASVYDSVKCWGANNYGQSSPPSLDKIKMISAGAYHTCALDIKGVRCWGSNEFGQAQVPRLKNPKMVSAGWHHSCAIDDNGVKCWGGNGVKDWLRGNGYEQIKVPSLKNPRMVVAGMLTTCALDEEGMKCWDQKATEVLSSLQGNDKNPILLSCSSEHLFVDISELSGSRLKMRFDGFAVGPLFGDAMKKQWGEIGDYGPFEIEVEKNQKTEEIINLKPVNLKTFGVWRIIKKKCDDDVGRGEWDMELELNGSSVCCGTLTEE